MFRKRKVGLFVIDECHSLLLDGATDFRWAWEAKFIRKVFLLLKRPPLLFMSATIDQDVRNEIRKISLKRKLTNVVGELNRPNLKLFYHLLENQAQKNLVTYSILKNFRKTAYKMTHKKGLIYFSSVKRVKAMHSILSELGFKTLMYHANVKNKDMILEEFKNSKDVIMLTTSALGVGVNIKDIQFTIIFDTPSSIIELIQRAGRAGRNDKPAPIILLDSLNERSLWRYIFKNSKNTSDKGKKIQYRLLNQLHNRLDMEGEISLEKLNQEFLVGMEDTSN